MEYLDIVNKNDEVISTASKQEVYKNKLHHRIVHILIFDDKNRLALQLRSNNVFFSPSHWSTPVGGHVRVGEKPVDAALREYQEELGTQSQIEFFAKDWYEDDDSPSKFLYIYKTIYNGPFHPDLNAVEKIEFFDFDQIKNMIISGEKFHPELLFLLKKYFEL